MRAFVVAVAFALAACSGAEEARVDDGGVDASGDAAAADASDTDAGEGDAASIDASEPLEPTVFPLGPEAVVSVSSPGAIDIYGTAFTSRDAVTVVFERFDEPFTVGRLYAATSTGGAFSDPVELSVGSLALRGGPSSFGDSLYFIESASINARASVSRARFEDGAFSPAEPLPAIAGVDSLLSWPRFVPLADDRVAVVFRDGAGRGRYGFSEDGLAFDDFDTFDPGPLAQPELGRHADGSLVFTFQMPVGNEPMISFVRHGENVVRLSTSSSNVHDARIFNRADGGLDIYYIYPLGPPGFSIFRRSLALDGTLGPEQQLTISSLGDATKPSPQRLPDGGILLLYAEITRRAPQGYPSEQILRALWIRGDAPAAE